ncbi:sporulation protein YunB [Peribacillus cavernae]|uniref:sporulation protein YunB n=1 Tax=Peribacillus cavernae TaxID=1674310 RepID=UPI001FE943DB|nr:sporulation protein YunB [Peribacillus cavernae]MDQ0219666.1 sporulation protein YunB [Peribacillus cavernae]
MAFKRRQKGPLPLRYVFLLTFVFFVFSTAGGLFFINKGIEPALMSFAEAQSRKLAIYVINKAINQKIVEETDTNAIIQEIPTQNKNAAPSYSWNTALINRIQGETQNLILMNLKEAEKGNFTGMESLTGIDVEMDEKAESSGLVFNVPLGQATNMALLGNLGPKIPVKFEALGDAKATIKWNSVPSGINNTVVDFYIHVKVNVQIIIPFATEVTTVEHDIPLGWALIPGEVPQYFNNGGTSNPAVELPKTKK